ncbi:MAG: family 43 glycosylhydrolase [Lachnospiraceae bacterium]|nr:family 43 glycosylhydrolase [Lachnospiraceae bacterium]
MENWYADNGDGTYTNPILYTDYSDPDAIRVGDDFFMTASSFCNTPGLPILHSKDLVNWEIIGYGLQNIPYESYALPRHGCGVWAPAIRYYNGEFVIFFPMPDEGIFMIKTKDPWGDWSEPVPVFEGAGWIDPCPFIDDDGKAYMVNAFARSRIGFKSVLQIVELSDDLTRIIGEPVRVFDGNINGNETIEGPKLYKRNGWYYIFAPAGGVKQGWQTVLRSRNIYGSYEFRNVMEQKDTPVNGPHQGAWVDTPAGEDWFIHFQDVYAAGRIVHLQPLRWADDWPVIGKALPGEICGKPVGTWSKPKVRGTDPADKEGDNNSEGAMGQTIFAPDTSDDFDGELLGLQWQWNANYRREWIRTDSKNSSVILNSIPAEASISDQPNLLLQKWPMPEFRAVTKLNISGLKEGDETGIVNMGVRYAALSVYFENGKFGLRKISGEQVFNGEIASAKDEVKCVVQDLKACGLGTDIWFKYSVTSVTSIENDSTGKYIFPIPREIVTLSYSLDGHNFIPVLDFEAKAGRWVGVKCGMYIRYTFGKEGGEVSSDYFVFE